ncbi:MAG TPA: META domain-containing protein [Bacteroidia bacterium]
MKKTQSLLALSLSILLGSTSFAQTLQAGFDKQEYTDMMKISARFGDSAYYSNLPVPGQYHFEYRSPIVGLDNCWDLWISDNRIGIISIRGTTVNSVSWLANFYAAMVPAKGELHLGKKDEFKYELASDPKAAVHVGWLVSTAFLSKTIVPKIDSCRKAGIKEFIIIGHSQGGAIAYLLTAHLNQLKKQNTIASDIRFKTYCSAAPKPGNLYFAYEYENLTQNGWAYNVVNSADWVPEVPVTIQTLKDYNNTNPFMHAETIIKEQKFPTKLVLKKIYRKLDKPTKRAQKNYQKYLGKLASKMVKGNIKGYRSPKYYPSNHYVRTGNTIVLYADESYYKAFPENPSMLFNHHFHQPYLYLTDKLQYTLNDKPNSSSPLSGSWELEYLYGVNDFNALYSSRKPKIDLNSSSLNISGNTSCNSFSGNFILNGNNIGFSSSMAMTKMFCEGEGEIKFLEALAKVKGYFVTDGKTLTMVADGVTIMRFKRI